MDREATALTAINSARFSYRRAALNLERRSMMATRAIEAAEKVYLRTAQMQDEEKQTLEGRENIKAGRSRVDKKAKQSKGPGIAAPG